MAFTSIEKEEQKVLTEYFKAANIKMRVVDPESQARMDLDEIDESGSSQEGKPRKRRAVEQPANDQ